MSTSTTERKTIHRWIWVWDFEKEELWLNEMAMQGWVLEEIGFCTYHFARCEPGEYIVRMEMAPDSEDYRSFLEEIGAEYIGRMVKWIYFRRKTELGPFDLLAGIDAKIQHLDRIDTMLKLVCFANVMIGIINILNGITSSVANLLGAALLSYALGRIHGKKEHLEIERTIHE